MSSEWRDKDKEERKYQELERKYNIKKKRTDIVMRTVIEEQR